MHRAVSRAVTALLILVIIIMGGLLTALMLWPDGVSPDESAGNDAATMETEVPEEIELDEEVFNSIQVLMDLWANRRMPDTRQEQIEEEPVITSEVIAEEEAVTIPSEQIEQIPAAIEEEEAIADEDIPIEPEGTIKDEDTSSDDVINALNTLIERWKTDEKREEADIQQKEEESIEELRPEGIEENMTALESEGFGTSFYSTELDEIHIAAQGSDPLMDSSSQDLALPPITVPPLYTPEEEVPSNLSWADSIQNDTTTPPVEPVYNDDYFKDFYIQGEDDLSLIDSIYYMDLYINNEYKGSVSVLLQSNIPYLYTDEIKTVVFEAITTEAYDRIFLGQGENISLDELNLRGVETSYDPVAFRIDLNFTIQDMPVRVISLSSKTYNFHERSLSDAEVLKPAVFTLKSSYGLSFSWSLNNYKNWNYVLGLSVRNEASLFDVFSSFNYSLRLADNKLSFDFGSYSFRYDFVDEMLRLSWGNVFSGRTSPAGVPIGFTLSKNTSYGDGTYKRKNDYNTTIDIVTESEVEVFNEGKSIFKRTLQPGTYRLEDFVLYSGVNKVLIRITPVNGSAPTEVTKEFSWYSSMLAPGEFYYTLSFAFGREEIAAYNKRGGALAIPFFDSKILQYDIRNFGASFDMRLGLAPSLSFAGGVSMNNIPSSERAFNPSLRADAEFTHINFLGTTRYNSTLNAKYEDGIFCIPALSVRIGHQASTGLKALSSVNLSGSWTGSRINRMFDYHAFTLSLGVSGRLGFLGWSSGFSSNITSTDPESSSYSVYSSLSTSLGRRGSLSTSLNLSGIYGDSQPAFSISVYASFSFNGGSVNTSASASHTKVSANAYSGSNSFSASLSAPGWNNLSSFKDPESYDFSTSYGTSFSYFGLSMGLSGDIMAKNLHGSVYLSTSSVFADGLFAFTPSIPSNFLLIKQKGILKGNELSAGVSGSSRFTSLPTTFSTAIYQGSSSNRTTDLMLYSTPKDSLLLPASFAISMPPSRGRGYVYRIDSDPLYSIAATIEYGGTSWINGSSPLYKVEDNELIATDEYIFTDENGLMLLSGLEEGIYAFDVPLHNGWALMTFTVDGTQLNLEGVNIFSCNETSVDISADSEVYSEMITLVFKESVTSDDFWASLYPDVFERGAV